jgi:hypothetical protein
MKTQIANTQLDVDVYMARGNGYGQYKICANFKILEESEIICFHSTDSQLWDEWNSKEDQAEDLEERLLNVIYSSLEDYIVDALVQDEWSKEIN